MEALAAIRAAEAIAMPSCELYPTASVPSTLGHPVRLPLGIHRLTGRRYALFDEHGHPCAFTSTNAALRRVLDMPRVPVATIHRAWAHFQGGGSTPTVATAGCDDDVEIAPRSAAPGRAGTTSPVIRRVDANVSPLDLLAELAPESALRRVGQGWLGWCPFHHDHAPDALGRPGTPSFYAVFNRRHGWSWRCLSSNCAHSVGPMRHGFRLYQELLRTDVPAAIRAARGRWPAIDEAPDRALDGSVAMPRVTRRVEGDDDPERRAAAPQQCDQGEGDAQGP